MKGVAAEEAAGQQAHQSGVRGPRLMGEGSQEEIQEDCVESVQADVENFVLSGCDPLHHLVLKTEGESC